MANTMKLKRSAVPGKVPAVADLQLGEIAINTYDGKAYMKKNVSGVETVVLMTGAGSGDVVGPASSADNAIARFDGTSGKIVQNSSATIDDSGNVSATTFGASGTGANTMPVGTTAQRPGTPTAGMYRLNSTTGEPEWWDANNSIWQTFRDFSYNIEYIVVAGGGGGGWDIGGGGGAGGVITGTVSARQSFDSFSFVIGGGGAGGTNGAQFGGNGSNTTGFGQTAIGGGGGGPSDGSGQNGGSGGGMGGATGAAVGSGTSGQGNAGGSKYRVGTVYAAGGGGGKNAVGGNGSSAKAGDGGAGVLWSNGGYFGGGGGGGWLDTTPAGILANRGLGGDGGGGGGGVSSGATGVVGPDAGQANTGGGGGGGAWQSSPWGQGNAGGSGIVILRYLGAQRGSGGTVTSAGGYTYHTFTTSGTYAA